jgi:putative membrane protein
MLRVALFAQVFGGRVRHGWAHPWMGVVMLSLVAAAIGLTVWLLVRSSRTPTPFVSPPIDPAMDILRARFARGEIDAEEFAARAVQLSGSLPPSPPPPTPANT